MASTDRSTRAAETGEQREPGLASTDEESSQAEGEEKTAWTGHPFNVRLSFWTPWGRVYLVLVGGPERRPSDRRREDRKRHPLWTRNNVFGGIGLAVILFAAGILGLAAGQYVAFKVLGI